MIADRGAENRNERQHARFKFVPFAEAIGLLEEAMRPALDEARGVGPRTRTFAREKLRAERRAANDDSGAKRDSQMEKRLDYVLE